MHLVDHARAHIEKTYTRPWHDRALRWLLTKILPYPGRFRLALAGAKLGKPFRRLIPGKLGAMFEEIRAKAPGVTIVLVTYPRVFPVDAVNCSELSLSREDTNYLLEMGQTLEDIFVYANQWQNTDTRDANGAAFYSASGKKIRRR